MLIVYIQRFEQLLRYHTRDSHQSEIEHKRYQQQTASRQSYSTKTVRHNPQHHQYGISYSQCHKYPQNIHERGVTQHPRIRFKQFEEHQVHAYTPQNGNVNVFDIRQYQRKIIP